DHQLGQRHAPGMRPAADSCSRCLRRIVHERLPYWSMYQYVRLFGCVPVDGGFGRSLSSGESGSEPITKGTTSPLSSSTMPPTGEGGRPPPETGSSRLLVGFVGAA